MSGDRRRFLVTGLCLSRNLGGPAMGLTLVEGLRVRYPESAFQFAVAAPHLSTEQVWAQRYNMEVVPRDTLLASFRNHRAVRLLKMIFGRPAARDESWAVTHAALMQAYAEADIVIDMSGISYVGDGTRDWRSAVQDYTSFHYARKHRKPFCRFVQSYGPFDDPWVARIARRELKSLPFIMARGVRTAEFCRELVPGQRVYDVPDIAILLAPAGDDWGEAVLARLGLEAGRYAVLSPSAVIAHLPEQLGGAVGQQHIDFFVRLTEALLRRGADVLFVPHMYSRRAEECDREVCREILSRLPAGVSACLVEQDMDPREAKWLIGHAECAVVSRYHALVAALSSSVPAVAVGWNTKYEDILAYYETEGAAIDARSAPAEVLVERVLASLDALDREKWVARLCVRQRINVERVRQAFGVLGEWIDGV